MVVFNILDHYIRRPEADRVMGALLGNISEEDGVVEIRNCFPVPHSEGEQVRILSLLSTLCLLPFCICKPPYHLELNMDNRTANDFFDIPSLNHKFHASSIGNFDEFCGILDETPIIFTNPFDLKEANDGFCSPKRFWSVF